MNRKYKRHFDDFAIGENEALYAAMAAQGWQLKKRGARLSRFERAEPAVLRYRIEIASPGWLEDAVLPDEQLALYEECGWHFVTRRGLVCVFCAPEGGDAPEFYTDPRQQAQTLRALRRQYRSSWLAVALILAINLLLTAAITGSTGEALRKLAVGAQMALVEETALMLFYASLMLWGIYEITRGAIGTMRLHRRLKRGQPVDHAPHHRQVARGVGDALRVVCAAFALLAIVQWIGKSEAPLPLQADGPYLLLEDLGLTGERDDSLYGTKRESTVERSDSLAARHYDVYEAMKTTDGESCWMYQDVYVLRSASQAQSFALTLRENALFARSAEEFELLDVDGLDDAWNCGMEYVAVRGNRVCFLTYSEMTSDETLRQTILETLAARWAQE